MQTNRHSAHKYLRQDGGNCAMAGIVGSCTAMSIFLVLIGVTYVVMNRS